jgi:hypothetical protein
MRMSHTWGTSSIVFANAAIGRFGGRQASLWSAPRPRAGNPRCFILACASKALIVIRLVITRADRGFAAFANVPCLDSPAQEDLLLLLDDCESASRPVFIGTTRNLRGESR